MEVSACKSDWVSGWWLRLRLQRWDLVFAAVEDGVEGKRVQTRESRFDTSLDRGLIECMRGIVP